MMKLRLSRDQFVVKVRIIICGETVFIMKQAPDLCDVLPMMTRDWLHVSRFTIRNPSVGGSSAASH